MKKISKSTWVAIIFWLIPVIAFWAFFRFAAPSAAMLYILLTYVWYPVWAFVVCYIIGKRNRFAVWKWILPILFTILSQCVHHITYGITNILGETNVGGGFDVIASNLSILIICTGFSYALMFIGYMIGTKAKKK